MIQPNGNFYIDNRDIPPLRARFSQIELDVDGDMVENHQLDQDFDVQELTLEQGEHSFMFVADVHLQNGRRIDSKCGGHFDVEKNATFSPFIAFRGVGDTGVIRECKLSPSSE